MIAIVNEESSSLGEPVGLNLTGPKPRVIMMVGLRARVNNRQVNCAAMEAKGERILLVAGDPYVLRL